MIRTTSTLDSRSRLTWPAVSIVLLLILAIFMPPGLITAMNVYLLILAGFSWFYKSSKVNANLAYILVPFIIILAIGMVGGVGADDYLYLKDAWYVLNPPIIMSTGYFFYRLMPNMAKGLKAFVYGGSVISLIYISSFVMQPDLILQSSVKIREMIGTGYYAPALGLTILISCWGKWSRCLDLSVSMGRVCSGLCLMAVTLCFSRTMMIVAFVGVLAAYGFFAKKEIQRVLALSAVVGVVLVVLNLSLDVSNRDVQHTFAGKLARSLDEISVQDYTDFKSINENWRGFETARALKLYCAGTPLNWLFGFGFGQQVDLGLDMPLGAVGESTSRRYIPILHNGYAYLLVKGGGVSVLLYVFVLTYMYMVGRYLIAANENENEHARIMQAIAVSLAVTTWLVSGAFNKLDMFPYLLAVGFILAGTSRQKT